MVKKMVKGATCPPCGSRCIIMGLLSAVFAAAGLWVIVGGVLKQMGGVVPWTSVFGWYFGGFVLWCIAKVCKLKACSVCR